MRYSIILLFVSAIAFAGCRGGAHLGHDHDHDREGHVHAAETGHGHEEHATEDHEDAHAGHDHEDLADVHDREERAHPEGTHPEGEIVFTRAQAEAAGLTTEIVTPAPFSEVIRASGRVELPVTDEVTVAAAQGGVVSFAPGVTEGAAVAGGQTLANVSGRGMVEGDAADRARIEFEAAESAFRRAERLVEDKIVSQREFDEARRRYETARSALGEGAANGGTNADAANAGTGAGTGAKTAAGTGAGVRVSSPLTGYVKSRLAGQGEYVAAGQAIAVVARATRLQLRAEVSERHVAALPRIRGANFKSPYSPAVYRAGRVVSYGRGSVNGWIPVLLEFEGVADVVDGSSVEVWLRGAPIEDALTVPRSALTEEQGLYFVYVRLGAEEYAKREVTVGADDGERVTVAAGLAPGDEVVTRGATQVRLAAMSGIIPEGHSHSH